MLLYIFVTYYKHLNQKYMRFSIIIFSILLLFSGCSTSPSFEDNSEIRCYHPIPVNKESIEVLPSGISVLKKNGKYYLGGDVILTKTRWRN